MYTSTLFYLVLIGLTKPSKSEEINTIIKNGAIFKKIPDVLIYEKNIPLYFEMPRIPSNQRIRTEDCEKDWPDKTLCPLKGSTKALIKMNEIIDMKYNQIYTDKEISTELPLGCCGQIVEASAMPEVSSKKEFVQRRSNFVRTLIGIQGAIFKPISEITVLPQMVRNVAGEIGGFIDKIFKDYKSTLIADGEYSQNERVIIEFIKTMQNQFNEQESEKILDHCREHRLPIHIVTPDILKKDLMNITEEIKSAGLSLSIPKSDYRHYYNKELTRCIYTEESVIFELRVPVTYKQSEWELYEYNPIHFRFRDQICAISAEQAYVAVDKKNQDYITIQGRNLKNCEPEKGICYVDRLEEDAAGSPLCAESIIQNLPASVLNEHCNFRCEPKHKKILVKRSSEHSYIITNAERELRIEDANNKVIEKLSWSYSEYGAVEITLPCDQQLTYSKNSERKILVRRAFPCTIDAPKEYYLRRIIPVQWSSMSSATENTFENFLEIFNFNWKSKVPHINIKDQKLDFENTQKINDLGNYIIINAVGTALTLITFIYTIYSIIKAKINHNNKDIKEEYKNKKVSSVQGCVLCCFPKNEIENEIKNNETKGESEDNNSEVESNIR